MLEVKTNDDTGYYKIYLTLREVRKLKELLG